MIEESTEKCIFLKAHIAFVRLDFDKPFRLYGNLRKGRRLSSEYTSTMKLDFSIYDNLQECVYVTDADTYEIKYCNAKMLEILGIDSLDEILNCKCYEILQGKDSPCAMCTTPRLEKGQFYEWNYFNSKVDKHYALKDTLIEHEGKRFRLEIALDLTVEDELNKSISSYIHNESVLNEGMKKALAEEDPDNSIEAILDYFGQQFQSERAYVFEKKTDGTWDNTYEWCKKGVTEQIDNLKNVPDETFDVWMGAFVNGDNVIIKNLAETKEKDPLMYEYLEPQGINSLVVCPIVNQGKLIGFYGVDNPPEGKLDNVSLVFQITGYFLNYLLKRRDDMAKMMHLGFYDQLTDLKNRHAMNEDIKELADKTNVTVIFCDVMGLKLTNDVCGHSVGDRLLIRASDCLKKVFGGCGLYRIGGDELLVIATGYTQEEISEKLKLLKAAMYSNDAVMAVGTAFTPKMNTSFEKLLKLADENMYTEKGALRKKEDSMEPVRKREGEMERSYYPEPLYYLDETSHRNNRLIYGMIESLLGDNTAVGVVGGYYDSDYTMCFISGFALNILGYTADTFNSNTDNHFGNMVWHEDRPKLDYWMKASREGTHVMRIKNSVGNPVWINEMRKTINEEGGRPMWVASIRTINESISTTFIGNNYLLTAIIDAEDDTLYIQKTPPESWGIKLEKNYGPFEEILQTEISNFVLEEDRDKFKEYVSLETIKTKLTQNAMYEFSMRQPVFNDTNVFVRHRYRYFDKDQRFILCSLEDITYLAVHDSIVECLNNDGFVHYMERFLISSESLEGHYLMFFNICDFKTLNDILGFDGGNIILREVVDILEESFLNPRLIARAESDHFLCLIKKENLDLAKLDDLCQGTIEVMEKTLNFRIQCGIYEIHKNDTDIRTMCARAQLAQKRIESDLFKPYAFYDRELSESYRRKAELILDLSKAIENGHVKLHFQPVFDCKTGKLASAEALVRWLHPEDGLIPPDIFIPELEKKGKISELDLFVTDVVSKLYKERLGFGKNMVPVSVNLSRMNLIDRQMVEKIIEIIERDGVDPDMYRFELTESAFIHISKLYQGALDALRNKGTKILIDDFGSGYSSFEAVLECEFDTIKLDLSFVKKIGQNEKANAVVKSMITMAHQLNAKVIAEGVETEKQLDFLRENGCDYVQGYLFSKPLPQEKFIAMMDGAPDLI